MNTETLDATGSSTGGIDLTPTTIFGLLANDRRRYALHYLSNTVGPVALYDLAEQIAARENDPTYDRYEQILISLSHVHLPKLADAGVVEYDLELETVELVGGVDELTPFLDLAAAEDLA